MKTKKSILKQFCADTITSITVSHSMHFDGDVIITDPCYLIRDDDEGNDWSLVCDEDSLEGIGIKTAITRDTLYGDWSCTLVDGLSKKDKGNFCADAGRVAVASLDEVLKYNPHFDYHLTKPWTTSLVKDFRGTGEFLVVHIKGTYAGTSNYWNKGDTYEDDAVWVWLEGINSKTGEPIRYVGFQTGL